MLIKKFGLFLCFIITCSQFATAQEDSLAYFEYRAVQYYADFANDNIHALWNYNNLFTDLNKDLIKYQKARQNNTPLPRINYPHRNFLQEPDDFKRMPRQAYFETLENSDYLPPAFALEMNGYIKEMWKYSKEIEIISQELHAYVKSGRIAEDLDLEEAFQLLDRAENHYQNIHFISLDLIDGLQNLYASMEQPDLNDPLVSNGQLLEMVLLPCREVLLAMRQDDLELVSELKLNLDLIRELYVETVGEKLNEVRFADDESAFATPHIRYDFVLKQLDHFIDYTNEYIEQYEVRKRLPHGNSYFYYNNRLLNTYNRFGRGIVLQYNKYVDSTKTFLPKHIEAVSWMKTTRPEDLIPEEPIVQDTLPIIPVAGSETLEGFAYNNLVFLLDVSTSMDRPGKLDLLKSSFKYLISLMRPEDRVAIVVYSGNSRVVLPSTSASQKDLLISAIDSLESKGTSQVLKGVETAYSVAERNFIEGGNNKIILASDGAFVDDKKLIRLIKSINREDIALTVFYYNKTERSEEKDRLQKLARAGKGNYAHIRSENANKIMLSEAQKVWQ